MFFLHFPKGVTEILSVWLSDQYTSFLDRFFMSLMAEVLFLLKQENKHVCSTEGRFSTMAYIKNPSRKSDSTDLKTL